MREKRGNGNGLPWKCLMPAACAEEKGEFPPYRWKCMLDYDIVVSNRLRAGRPAGALERGRQDEAFFISAFCRLWGQDHSSAGKKPILGTVIVTDRCNLKCRHCSVHDLTSVDHPYEQIRREMELLYHMGVRILFLLRGRDLPVA